MSLSYNSASVNEIQKAAPAQHRALLLVDDEQENLDVLAALLEGRFSIHTAHSGEEALEMLEAGLSIDLVIADQRMAGMTGVQLLTQIAQRSPDTMRIIITGYSDVEPMVEAIDRGAVYSFVVKPYDPEELRGIVNEALIAKDRTELMLGLITELGERRDSLNEAARRLKNAQEELLAAERVSTVGQATTGIVHNLRNLSTIVYALVLEIRHCTTDIAMLRYAEESFDALTSLIQLLENIREFARLADTTPAPTLTDLRVFLERTTTLIEMQEQPAKCPVEVKSDPNLTLIPIDSGYMSQAVLALVNNAMRASEPGNPVGVSVRTVPQPNGSQFNDARPTNSNWVCIEVTDRGRGMDAATLARATEPFFSAFEPPRVGLGLETARLVASAHRGRLELDSAPGQGTRARLLFPLRRPA